MGLKGIERVVKRYVRFFTSAAFTLMLIKSSERWHNSELMFAGASLEDEQNVMAPI